jgi:hypothetical protein
MNKANSSMRNVTLVLALALVGISWTAGGGVAAAASEYWVSPNGADDQPGTQDRPFATLARAQQAVRQLVAKGLTEDARVTLQAGVYRLDKPLTLLPEDSGAPVHRICYGAAADQRVIVSGGRRIEGWREGEGGTWVADVPEARNGAWAFTQLWVNGRCAVRARTPNADDANPHWQLASAELSPDLKRFTIGLAPGLLKPIGRTDQVEVMIAGNWEINRKRVATIDAASGVVELAPPHIGGPEYIQPAAGRWRHVYNVMNRLCDGGCIYTLGWQPGAVIRGNHLHDVHRSPFAQGAPNNGMFIDQGSKGYLFEKNVIYDTSAELVRFNACQRDWHTWRDNHFGERETVLAAGKETVDNAGPQPPYRQRFARQNTAEE